MYRTTKLIETNRGVFRKGVEVDADIAKRYSRYVEEVKKPKKAKKQKVEKVEAPKEELLIETPSAVEVEVEETKEEVLVEEAPKKKKLFGLI